MKRLSASIALAGVLIGVPLVLLRLAGAPAIPSFSGVRLTDTYMPLDPILGVVALIAWILWAYVAGIAVLRAVAVAVGHGSGNLLTASTMLTPRPLRLWIDLAIGGALLASTLHPRAEGKLEQVSSRARTVATAESLERADAHAFSRVQPRTETYRVRTGDSLWRIAERKLGSGFRWREIFEVNRGKSFNNGQRLTDPRLIRPGWQLELPKHGSRQLPHSVPQHPLNGHQELKRAKAAPSPDPVEKPIDSSHRTPASAPVVRLPSGIVVATSFASGLMTAELFALLKRRRRFRPLADPVEQPAESDLVREIRGSGAAEPGPSVLDVAVGALDSMWLERFGESPPLVGALERGRRVVLFMSDLGAQLPAAVGGSFSPRIRFQAKGGVVEAEVTGPFSPQLDGAGAMTGAAVLVPAGHAPGAVFHLAPFGLGLLAVEGPRGSGLARQMLISAATRSEPDDLEVILVGTGEDLRDLEELPHVVRSVPWGAATDAIREIQAEFLRRARAFFEEGVESARAYHIQRADDRMPALLIVAGAPPNALRGVVEALAVETSRLGAAFVALGWKPQSTRLQVLAADRVEFHPSLAPQASGFAPLLLDADAARDSVDVLVNAHADESGSGSEESPTESESASEVSIEDPTGDAIPEVSVVNTTPRSQPEQLPAATIALPPAPAEGAASVAEIRCLGPIVVARSDGTIPGKGWRAPAKELLAHLLLHPDGVHKERLAEVFFPGMPTKKALDLLARAASVVRTRVRTPGDKRKYVELEGETWRLERGVWRVDAWDMERLITQERPAEPELAIANLRAALALYRGEFCDDTYFGWAQASRERYRALFLRASAQLAERLCDSGDREAGLATLERAIEMEPLCEDLYRQAMMIEASLGRGKEALDRYGRLKRLLETELNCDPDRETDRLARDIERSRSREYVSSS